MWPDWSGETAVIVGTGPSAAKAPLGIAEGRARAIVVKSAWRLAPWADVLYGLDKGWWMAHRGVPEFKGMKVSPSPTACCVFKLRWVRLRSFAKVLTGETGVLGCGLRTGGGHSGFQAINLAIQFGAKRIVLVGFDMTLAHGAHWREEHGVMKPDPGRTASWREALDGCADQFRELGVEVVNASEPSALVAFEKMPLCRAIGQKNASKSPGRSDQSGLRSTAGRNGIAGGAVADIR